MKRRKHLTPREMEIITDAARDKNRHGHRDATMIMIAFRHALRSCEIVSLRWSDIELDSGQFHVVRKKGGLPSVHPLQGDEIRALRKLQRESNGSPHVFQSERKAPLSVYAYRRMIERIGAKAQLEISTSSHMLRHACGFKLANQGVDTRALQQYMGHSNIRNTVIYTQMAPNRFKNFWRE